MQNVTRPAYVVTTDRHANNCPKTGRAPLANSREIAIAVAAIVRLMLAGYESDEATSAVVATMGVQLWAAPTFPCADPLAAAAAFYAKVNEAFTATGASFVARTAAEDGAEALSTDDLILEVTNELYPVKFTTDAWEATRTAYHQETAEQNATKAVTGPKIVDQGLEQNYSNPANSRAIVACRVLDFGKSFIRITAFTSFSTDGSAAQVKTTNTSARRGRATGSDHDNQLINFHTRELVALVVDNLIGAGWNMQADNTFTRPSWRYGAGTGQTAPTNAAEQEAETFKPTCWNCWGRGRVTRYKNDWPYKVTCEVCGGTGKLENPQTAEVVEMLEDASAEYPRYIAEQQESEDTAECNTCRSMVQTSLLNDYDECPDCAAHWYAPSTEPEPQREQRPPQFFTPDDKPGICAECGATTHPGTYYQQWRCDECQLRMPDMGYAVQLVLTKPQPHIAYSVGKTSGDVSHKVVDQGIVGPCYPLSLPNEDGRYKIELQLAKRGYYAAIAAELVMPTITTDTYERAQLLAGWVSYSIEHATLEVFLT